jgi:hypothetical protein
MLSAKQVLTGRNRMLISPLKWAKFLSPEVLQLKLDLTLNIHAGLRSIKTPIEAKSCSARWLPLRSHKSTSPAASPGKSETPDSTTIGMAGFMRFNSVATAVPFIPDIQ